MSGANGDLAAPGDEERFAALEAECARSLRAFDYVVEQLTQMRQDMAAMAYAVSRMQIEITQLNARQVRTGG